MPIDTYLGKGLKEPCSPYRTAYYFGAELNVPSAEDWNCLPDIVEPATSFDLSPITINHEICTALLNITDKIYAQTNVIFSWYRKRDNKRIYQFEYIIPPPSDYGWEWWNWYYVNSYIGYVDWEINEDGGYYVTASATGGVTTNKRIDFSITGVSAATCSQQFTLVDDITGAYITGATILVGEPPGVPCTEYLSIERYQIDDLVESSWYNVIASKSGYTCPSDICKDTFQACMIAITLKLKAYSAPPITCNGATPNFNSGCALLLFFDTNNDGIISATERDDAWEAEFLGHITHEEAQFVEDAYNAGSINALCSSCFVTPSLNISPTSHSSPICGDTFTISITSNIAWTVSDDMAWIHPLPSSGSGNVTITITVDENKTTDARSGNVFATGEGITRKCTITQGSGTPVFDAAITEYQPPTSLFTGDDVRIPTTIENRGSVGNFRVFLIDNDTGLEIDHKPTDTWKHLSGDSITITFAIFGDPLAYGAIPNNQIIEFVEFLRTNTNVEIITEIKSYAEVPDPSYWPNEYKNPCYLLAPWNIPDNIKAELTGDIVFLLWNNGNKYVCLGGATWGPDAGINGSPVCSLAFNTGYFAEPFETFDYHGAFNMAFEFCNACSSISEDSGGIFPSPEACPAGKTLTECLQWCLVYLPNVTFGGIYTTTMEGIMPDKDWNLMLSVREESTGDLDTKEFIINKLEGGIGIIESYSAPAELEEGEELIVSFIAKNIGAEHGILGGFKMHLWIDGTKYDDEPDLSWKSLANNETWEHEVNTIGSVPLWSMPNHDVNVSIILEDKYGGNIAAEVFVVAIKSVVCSEYTDETSCLAANCYWHDSACHEYGSVKCSDHTDALTCVSNNCYWYDGICHDTEESLLGRIELITCSADKEAEGKYEVSADVTVNNTDIENHRYEVRLFDTLTNNEIRSGNTDTITPGNTETIHITTFGYPEASTTTNIRYQLHLIELLTNPIIESATITEECPQQSLGEILNISCTSTKEAEDSYEISATVEFKNPDTIYHLYKVELLDAETGESKDHEPNIYEAGKEIASGATSTIVVNTIGGKNCISPKINIKLWETTGLKALADEQEKDCSAQEEQEEEGTLADIIALLVSFLGVSPKQAKLIIYGGGGLLALSFIMPMFRR